MKTSLISPVATPSGGDGGTSNGGVGIFVIGLAILGLAYLGYQHLTKDKEEAKAAA